MLGTILLGLLAILCLFLLVLLFLPVSLRVSYEAGNFRAWLRYASLTIPLFPREKKEKPPKKEKPKKPSKRKSKPAKPEQKKKKFQKPNWQQITYSLDVLPKVFLRAVRRMGRRIRITPLQVHLLIATSDPADTAVLYGKLYGGLDAFLPLLHRAVRIEKQDIQLFPDFTQERMDYIVDIGIQIRPFDALVVALRMVGGCVKWFIGYRKRADKIPPAPQETATAQATK